MKAQEIRELPEGTNVRGKFGEGRVIFSPKYGKGVRFSKYPYSFAEDMHGFNDCEDSTLEELVKEIVS
jgi:hypothetical protein